MGSDETCPATFGEIRDDGRASFREATEHLAAGRLIGLPEAADEFGAVQGEADPIGDVGHELDKDS